MFDKKMTEMFVMCKIHHFSTNQLFIMDKIKKFGYNSLYMQNAKRGGYGAL